MATSNAAEMAGALMGLMHAIVFMMQAMYKILLVAVPQSIPSSSGIVQFIDSHAPFIRHNTSPVLPSRPNSAIYRALVQVLELINEIPASSRKYPFARDLAEKMMEENREGRLGEVNRLALETAFIRTIKLLTLSLEEEQAPNSGGGIFRNLPLPLMKNVLQASVSAQPNNGDMSEKLCDELVWITEKMKEDDGCEAAVLHWSSASRLSLLALYASSRVQRLLIKLSTFLCGELAAIKWEISTAVKADFLLLWLPLLCSTSTDGAFLSAAEKVGTETNLKRIIACLPESYQERVLSVWLCKFSGSSSDFPNLRSCYDDWCQHSRRLSQLLLKDE